MTRRPTRQEIDDGLAEVRSARPSPEDLPPLTDTEQAMIHEVYGDADLGAEDEEYLQTVL